MPDIRNDVVIIGAAGAAATVMVMVLVKLPAMFVARTLKLNLPAAVGVPVIVPVLLFILSPGGKLEADIDHVMGVVPVEGSV